MKLVLTNGYPYPPPPAQTNEQLDKMAEAAAGTRLEIHGVLNFEWLHTVTVELESAEAYARAQTVTGWQNWSANVLEATTSRANGYGHPALVVGGKAYCGFQLWGA